MFYRFYYDDGIIHNQADGQDHGKHGQGVDGKAQQHEGAKCTDQGHRNRQHGNQGGPEISQKDVHDN